MATISDVARLAGVATSTVSHVLNGTRFVSAETARAVHDAVQAVGYTPNTLARALAMARSTTNTIGLAMSSTRNRYFADVINAIEAECAQLGMMVLLANTHDDPDRELDVVAALHRRRVDGIILAPCCHPDHAALHYLRDKRIPAVMVDRLPDFPLDGVGVENRQSMAALVDHLVGHGHTRIGFLAGQFEFCTAQERTDGYRDGLTRHGIPVDETLISIGHTTLDSGREAAGAFLSGPARVTAVIGANNLTTIGTMLAARDAGLRVPGDLAVAGFDDFDWADAFEPRLTALVQPCQAIGRAAALQLKKRIDGIIEAPELLRLPPTLAIRTSCGCHGADARGSEAIRTLLEGA